MLDWRSLYYGHVSPQEVAQAVKDPEWQALRRAMKGKSLETKYAMLKGYRATMIARLDANLDNNANVDEWRMVEVRITNYVTALSRGGLIKPEDYR